MTISSPIAATRPHSFTAHGVTIEDPWAWLKDANYPDVNDKDVLAYLEAENAYFEQAMAPHRPLVDRLYEEMKARIKEDESSVPQKDGDWLYWTAFETGGEYRKWWRRPVGAPDDGIAPGTRWADVPMNWTCPECGARKDDFEMTAI